MGRATAGRIIALTATLAAGLAGACGSAMLRPDAGGGTGGPTAGSGGGGGGGATAGTGGATGGSGGGTGGTAAGTGGAIGGRGGTSGGTGGATGGLGGTTGGAGAGAAGTGGGGTGGAAVTFVGGPCIVTSDRTAVEVFGRTSDGRVVRRAFDGGNWLGWSSLSGLDGRMIDARSDLDCSATLTSVQVVASGLNPVGGVLRAFGSGTAYNPFVRELPGMTFDPGPSIYHSDDSQVFVGAAGPGLFQLSGTSNPMALTPITTQTDPFRSGPDIAVQPSGASGLRYYAAFDATGVLAIYYNVINSAGASWQAPVKLSAPVGTFTHSPTICTENGAFGVFSVNVVAVAGGRLWYARASSITSSFSSWTMITMDAASSPDCAVAGGADSIVHVVTLSAAGTMLDINGKGTSWVATDLGSPL